MDINHVFKEILTNALSFIPHIWPILLVLGFFLLVVFVIVTLQGKEEPKGYLYPKVDFIMTKSERDLFKILAELFEQQYYIFPQIHLDLLLDYKSNGDKKFGAFRHVNEKSVDFIICEKDTTRTLLAIELDDWSHNMEYRKKRDAEVEAILAGAGLPLLRIPSGWAFDKEKIKNSVLEKILK